MADLAFGIDIGGSAIKAGRVDLGSGSVQTRLSHVATPMPSTPEAIIAAMDRLLDLHGVSSTMPVGISIPAPVVHGVVPSMANLDQKWTGVDVPTLVEARLGHPVTVVNDADAAALGEVGFGAAKGVAGTVIVTTLGTGIGSGVVVDGRLVPNVELGHLEIDSFDAETRASARQKNTENLSWEQWAARLQRYYSHVEKLFSPDLFVVGGAISEQSAHFLPLLDLRTPIVPAVLRNRAGVIGAALAASLTARTEP
ncbi:polyphosphate--glucose phosphotransferase [Promicromonospora sp. NPDC090134]|uniref:polyphosphate--glucose phosphotransferase n=1 Tax=Promicromonospora sp. NPDC090134 TaxID=3364408 RepID=UPI0038052125